MHLHPSLFHWERAFVVTPLRLSPSRGEGCRAAEFSCESNHVRPRSRFFAALRMTLDGSCIMKECFAYAVAAIVILAPPPVQAATETKPVRMGAGAMTFETVPGWGLLPDGQSALGPTHGSVVVDRLGNIYLYERAEGRCSFLAGGAGDSIVFGRQVCPDSRHEDPRGGREGVHLRRAKQQRRGNQVPRPDRGDRIEAGVPGRVRA